MFADTLFSILNDNSKLPKTAFPAQSRCFLLLEKAKQFCLIFCEPFLHEGMVQRKSKGFLSKFQEKIVSASKYFFSSFGLYRESITIGTYPQQDVLQSGRVPSATICCEDCLMLSNELASGVLFTCCDILSPICCRMLCSLVLSFPESGLSVVMQEPPFRLKYRSAQLNPIYIVRKRNDNFVTYEIVLEPE